MLFAVINECASNPCPPSVPCVDLVNAYRCDCPQAVDVCASNPCLNNGTCEVTNIFYVTYVCTCPPGFTGTNCQININECLSNKCAEYATCVDGINNYTCICPPGFTGPYCTIIPKEERLMN
ncbi:NOTCH-like protein [Mya arenaria]|uniref:NOTCH-like protein n=1 Tax=Mya arenaria TaxID=6604 RepID=A0ABY7DD58_MYAAR|nr:NOTCH-like protein [Mya arenaria]